VHANCNPRKGEGMSAHHIISRRTLLSTGASLLATGASFIIVPKGYAESGSGTEVQPSLVQGEHHMNDKMQQCIELCRDCHAMCMQTIAHGLKLGGRHAVPDHIRLLMDCAQMCTTTVDYMLRGSSFHDRVCRLCSDLCAQCGQDCVKVAGDDQLIKRCIEVCRQCAESCERMASEVAA
jgi:hypothetical protein